MVTPWFYPVIGGTESFVEEISIKLTDLGVPTDVMTFDLNRFPTTPNWRNRFKEISVIRVPTFNHRPFKFLSYAIKIHYFPKRFSQFYNDYDIVHFHNEVDLTFPSLSLFIRKPKIFHCHCLNITHSSYKRNPLKRQLLKNVADLYVTVSDSERQKLVDLGVNSDQIRVIFNGVNTECYAPFLKSKSKNSLLFVGRLEPNKGLHVLLKSLEYLNSPIELTIVGPTSEISKEYSERVLLNIANINKKMFHRVKYIGVIEKEELVQLYQEATLLVCPSLSEPFGIVNLEALSCKTPVIASNVGGIPHIIRNNKNGILVPPNDPPELAKAIQSLLDNEQIRREFGEDGRKWVVQNFSIEAVAERLCELYRELLG